MAGAIINHASINLKFKKAVATKSSVIKPRIEKAKKKAFDEFIRDFKNHPITKEITAGPSASNSSGTLGGYGNLFSFIGFDGNDRPVEIIEQYILNKLRKSIRMVPDTKKGGWRVTIAMPSMEEIAALTPMPWAGGRSWVVGIHAGISGLGQYMYTHRAPSYTTRSGTAFQTDTRLRGGGFQNTPYMVPLLRFLEKRLNENVRIMVKP